MSYEKHTGVDQSDDAAIWRRDLVRLRFEWYDFAICFALAFVACWFLFNSADLAEQAGGAIGPATFPVAIAGLLAFFVTLLFIQSVIRILRGNLETPVEIRRPISVLFGGFLIIAFVFFMDSVGFYPTALVWLVLFGYVAGVRKPLHLAGLTVGFLVFAFLVFEKLLGTPLP